jgi:NADH:ubiquinone oxidoreductase subunit H
LFISFLAETNRTPFDLLEAESELVAGFLVEYSSIIFVAYYLAEYCMILFWSFLFNILFTPSLSPIIYIFIFIWVRASLPRLRFDQLMDLGWSYILPLSISLSLFYFSFVYLFN